MKKVLWVILIIIILIPIAGYIYVRSFLPDYDGELKVAGLTDKVTIQRNQYAVPSIEAENLEDLLFAWGYVNAQDRMFQMEVTKRIGQGRISEFAGESTLSKDLFLRAVGFYDIAKREVEKLPPEYKALFQRYVDGVNYYIENEKKPLYMTLLGLETEKWTLADPVVVGMMLNWSLAYNMSHELIYHKISEKIGKQKREELLNLIPPQTPTIVENRAADNLVGTSFFKTLNEFGPLMGGRSASNNWVIAPLKTAYSGPILANDPHVHGSKIPSDFYLIHARAGDFQVTGGQVAGLPFIAFGYNQHIAWGVTNQGADIVDIFIETVNWDKKTYLFNGSERPLRSKTVEIKIKGKGPIQKTFYYAGRRPLLNEVFTDLKEVISIDWAGFNGMGISGFFELNRARNHAEFMAAANKIFISPQNMVYADVSGNIAYRTVGSLVKRKPGTGNFPQQASSVEANWDGLLDPDMNPSLLNPQKGYIITANNRVISDYPVDMNGTYAPRYRYEAIERMLAPNNSIDVAYNKKMQTDTHSVLSKKLIPLMKKSIRVADDPKAQKALELVLAWDGNLRTDLPAPAIYNTWLVRFMYQTFVDELGDELATKYVGQRYISLERFFSLLEQSSSFFDDVSTAEKETVSDIATRAFKEALQILEDYTGKADIQDWQWGKIHEIRFEHFLGKSKLMRPFVNHGPLALSGDCETNLRAHFYEITPPFVATLAAGLRLVVEFDPKPKGHIVLITGENEYFLSKHYTDLTDMWMKGEYFCMEDEKPAYHLILSPN
ncbi:MAG: penicillin acylase family protein [Deltaproteobacteria bacterium]|nr:penicillin acylase family protein [Deltaproteobacteria bacterium]